MDSRNAYCPEVPPVKEGMARPLWSVMIPNYNYVEYLREALTSVLMQDPGPEVMQIMVVDNCSTQGNPEAIVSELGKGRVEFYRQPTNVGMLNNFQTCLELSRGKLIHLLHSDDCVQMGFYQKMSKIFSEHPEIGAAFCRSIYIDQYSKPQGFSSLELAESGILPSDWLLQIAEVSRISVPSLGVVRREVYEKLGGMDSRCGLSADWEMWARIFVHFPMWFETEPLAMWRQHSMSGNVTSAKSNTFIRENFNTVEIIFQTYLPNYINSKTHQTAKQNCAFLALEAAATSFENNNTVEAITQIKVALDYSFSFRVLRSGCFMILRNVVQLISQLIQGKLFSRA